MKYRDLRDFMAQLESRGELRKLAEPVSPVLEMTAIGDKLLRAGGPAVLCQNPTGFTIPCLINLPDQPVWHDAAGRIRHGCRLYRRAARGGPSAGGAEGAGSPQGAEGCRTPAADGQGLVGHEAGAVAVRPLSGGGVGRGGAGPEPAAGADLLAWRRRAVDHLGAGRHPRAAVGGAAAQPPEPGHLSPAGDRPQPGHHALAGAPGRGTGLP